jgi:hypothetical protein
MAMLCCPLLYRCEGKASQSSHHNGRSRPISVEMEIVLGGERCHWPSGKRSLNRAGPGRKSGHCLSRVNHKRRAHLLLPGQRCAGDCNAGFLRVARSKTFRLLVSQPRQAKRRRRALRPRIRGRMSRPADQRAYPFWTTCNRCNRFMFRSSRGAGTLALSGA